MPWLQFLDNKEGFDTDSTHTDTCDPDVKGGGPSNREHVAIDDGEILAGLAALEKARAAVGDDVGAMGAKDCAPRVRGGTSQILKSGEAVHALQGQCTNRDAEAWARVHSATIFNVRLENICRGRAERWCMFGVTACSFL